MFEQEIMAIRQEVDGLFTRLADGELDRPRRTSSSRASSSRSGPTWFSGRSKDTLGSRMEQGRTLAQLEGYASAYNGQQDVLHSALRLLDASQDENDRLRGRLVELSALRSAEKDAQNATAIALEKLRSEMQELVDGQARAACPDPSRTATPFAP